MHPTAKAARVAGAWYLTLAVTGPFTLIYLPRKLGVPGDAAATAKIILDHETLFRLGLAGEVLGAITFVFVGMALYRLLSGVNKSYAAWMVILVLISATLGLVNVLNNLGALMMFRGADVLAGFDETQRTALGMSFLALHHYGNVINQIFWGLWLFPFGVLVMRSRFLPRILGAWLVVNGFAYVAMSATSLLMPAYAGMVSRVALPALFGEMAITLWLLIKGAKAPPAYVPTCAPAGGPSES